VKKLFVFLCFSIALVLFGLSVVQAESVSARLAAMKFPMPTFNELHEQFVHVCGNESGMKSLADQDGILQSLLHGGGGRKSGRGNRGQGYGLDYTRLMRQMAKHSKRTFPPHSKFLLLTAPQRAWLVKRRTRLNRWASTLKLDYSEPSGWPEKMLDGTAMMPWRFFQERCKGLIRSTRAILKGQVRSHCDGRPTTWGSLWDIQKPEGAIAKGWKQIHCDWPPDTPLTCGLKTKLEKWNGTTCARNTFWTWLIIDKEARNGKRKRANGARL